MSSFNDNDLPPNPVLRDHVTGFSFVLSMPRSAVASLDAIAHGEVNRNRNRLRYDNFVGGAKSCQARGLMIHQHKPSFAGGDASTGNITDFYRLTKAGWLVYDLLAEAGLVEAVTARKLRRLVA